MMKKSDYRFSGVDIMLKCHRRRLGQWVNGE